MSLKFSIMAITALSILVGCKSMNKAEESAQLNSKPKLTMSEQIALHQSVIRQHPILFSKQIRSNDLDAARKTADGMYQSLQTLETNRQLAAQVCFGANETACAAFRQYMSQDIRSLYDGFVVSNSLSTGELLRIATNIESSAALQYR